jgi:protein TonB
MSSQDRLDLVSARALDLNAVVPGGRDSSTPAPVIAASNVVPFLRVRREPAAIEPTPPLSADPSQRPAPDAQGPEGRLWIIAFFVLSLLVHGGLYAVLNREPEPMASIGLEAISVEIVVGDNTRAGTGSTPGESQAQSAPADDPDPKPMDTETMDEKAPETKPVPDSASASQEQTAAEAKPEQLAAVPPPEPAPQARPEQPKPVQKREPKAKPERDIKPKQVGPHARTASTEPDATGPRANAANGAGVGRSQADINYPGIVRAHLAKFQVDNHEQGRADVGFALDGNGQVTRVWLVHTSGVPNIDRDAQASVRRASPFPAPPSGRSMSFTVPVHFHF